MKGPRLPGNWREFATARQIELLEAWEEAGTQGPVIERFGCAKSLIDQAKASVAKKMRMAGQNDAEVQGKLVKDPYVVKGQSVMYDGDGNVKLMWLKTQLDKDQHHKALVEAFTDVCDNFDRARLTPPPAVINDQFLSLYPIADMHHGLRTYFEETGEEWDLDKAGRVLRSAVIATVNGAPPSKYAIIVQHGDHFDADDHKNRTPKSGNILDAEGSRHRIIWSGFRALADCIDLALQKHEVVYVYSLFGNHDINTAVALQIMLSIRYEHEPRVIVNDDANPHRYFEFGLCLFGFHHGDGVKPDDLPGIMANDMAEAWGRVKFRQCHSAHRHHAIEKDIMGTRVFVHPVISAASKHSNNAYRSAREFRRFDFSATAGEVNRQTVDISTIYALAGLYTPESKQPLMLKPGDAQA
ncbi:MAG: hypothetical protein AAF141_05840 [Pseudomonadota bacterium]